MFVCNRRKKQQGESDIGVGLRGGGAGQDAPLLLWALLQASGATYLGTTRGQGSRVTAGANQAIVGSELLFHMIKYMIYMINWINTKSLVTEKLATIFLI